MSKKDRQLTPKMELFCQEFVKHFNASRAALDAKYSPKTAAKIGWENLQKPEIQNRISEIVAQGFKNTDITVEKVLQELHDTLTVDIAEAYDDHGHMLPVHDMPKPLRRAISSIKVYEEFEGSGQDRVQVGEVREVKLWNKTKSIELAMKYLGLLIDKVELKTPSLDHISPEELLRIANGHGNDNS